MIRPQIACLGDIADVNWGNTSVTKSSYVSTGYPAFSATGCDGFLPYADYDRDAIVLSAIGARCGKTWFTTGKWSCIKNTIRFWSTTPELDNRYLFWATSEESFWPKRGAAQPFITIGDARQLKIPLPPISEQRRIAAILDQADALRAKRREALVQLDSLTQSIFIEMFGDPVTNPHGIKIVRLSEITTRITDGVHQKPNYTEEGVPFISVKDITSGVLKFDGCKYISLDDHNKFTKRCKAEYLDILYTKVGATYGRPALVDTDTEFSLYVSVCLIKPERKLVDSFFLNAALGTAAIKSQADRRIKGIGVPDLHLDQIQNLLIPLPTMEKQRKFAERVASVEHLKNKHRSSLIELDTLFASLQHSAFRGEL